MTRTTVPEEAPVRDEVLIQLDEALLADGLADVRWLLHDALRAGARRIVVDLSRVHSLGSAALATFLWAHRLCRARGGAVVLRGADRRTRDMVHRTGLWRVLRLQGGPARGSRRGVRPSGPGAREQQRVTGQDLRRAPAGAVVQGRRAAS